MNPTDQFEQTIHFSSPLDRLRLRAEILMHPDTDDRIKLQLPACKI
jgi:hypothetical protein